MALVDSERERLVSLVELELLESVLVSAVDSCHCRRASGSVFWFCYYSPVVELLVLLQCILTCKQVFSSSSIQGHLPWLRCSFDLVVHRPHRHHPFSLALRRRRPRRDPVPVRQLDVSRRCSAGRKWWCRFQCVVERRRSLRGPCRKHARTFLYMTPGSTR